jgi:hypothetical protein
LTGWDVTEQLLANRLKKFSDFKFCHFLERSLLSLVRLSYLDQFLFNLISIDQLIMIWRRIYCQECGVLLRTAQYHIAVLFSWALKASFISLLATWLVEEKLKRK